MQLQTVKMIMQFKTQNIKGTSTKTEIKTQPSLDYKLKINNRNTTIKVSIDTTRNKIEIKY